MDEVQTRGLDREETEVNLAIGLLITILLIFAGWVLHRPTFPRFSCILSDTLFWCCTGATEGCGLERGQRAAQGVRQSLSSLLTRRKISLAELCPSINLNKLNCQKCLKRNALKNQSKRSLCRRSKTRYMKTPRCKRSASQVSQSSCRPLPSFLLPLLLTPTSKFLE